MVLVLRPARKKAARRMGTKVMAVPRSGWAATSKIGARTRTAAWAAVCELSVLFLYSEKRRARRRMTVSLATSDGWIWKNGRVIQLFVWATSLAKRSIPTRTASDAIYK